MTQNGNREMMIGTPTLRRVSAALAVSLVAGAAPCAAQGLNDMLREVMNTTGQSTAGSAGTQGGRAPSNSTAPSGKPAKDGKVEVDENLIVEMHVKDEDLSTVLQMLSMQSQRNIIASQSVSATVTANLYGVTFFEALDSILHANGFGYVEKGNFIYVYTLEEIERISEATRVRIGKVVKLNYLNAIDAAEFVKPLLSDGGQIKSNGRVAVFNIPDNSPVGGEDYANESALVIYDYEENVAEIEKLIQALDTRPAQILIEATILQTELNEANAFGIDFGVIGDLNFADFVSLGGPLKAVEGLVSGVGSSLNGGSETKVPIPGARGDGRAMTSNVGNINGPATFKAGIVEGDVAVFLRLLDEVTDLSVISRPKLLTLNRQPARVLVGRKVGYLSTTATDTSTTQTVEFLDTGTQLYVRPFVTTEGTIRMELKPQVSEAVIRDVTDATGAAVTIPDEVTNELVANVMVRDGQTIVLGGLFRESTKATRRQIPVVGDLPIIGAAFRGHENDVQRSEIIFMVTPSIVSDAILTDQGRRGETYVEAVRTGSRAGLLPFSRTRQSEQHVVEAQRLAASGDVARANHKLNRALALNKHQPDAHLLREQIAPAKVKSWPSGSMLDQIIGNEARAAARATDAARPLGNQSSAAQDGSDAQTTELDHSSTGGTLADAMFEGNAYDQAETPANFDGTLPWWERIGDESGMDEIPGQGEQGAGAQDDAEISWVLPDGNAAVQGLATVWAMLQRTWGVMFGVETNGSGRKLSGLYMSK
ncbi:MAG: hypothetical protein KF838_03400 [Phycisphaeraceae bacterium]|nr:MAG: hypothetical protein KF838_03400 [Phycisphaeraceae bacterium]